MRTDYDSVTKYSDRLTFETEYKASASPSITLAPVLTNRFELSSATSTFSARRKDTHQVILNIVKGPVANPSRILAELRKIRDVAARLSLENANTTRLENLVIVRRDFLGLPLR